MRADQLKVCGPDCPHLFAYEFSVQGANELAPHFIVDEELADWLREGWTVTYHDHAGPRPPIN